ncbi:MAG: HEPN domain-containing protein [Planctomycetota bacterium]
MKPDVEKHLRVADETLREMEHLLAGGFHRGVVGRAYYAMLCAATAALTAKEIEKGSRQAIVPTFADAFVKTGLLDKKFHSYFRQAFGARTESDYPSFASADHRQAQTTRVRTKEFIAACRRLCE